MKKLFAAAAICLLFASSAVAEVPKETGQNELSAIKSAWQTCLDQNPSFNRLPMVDEELGPMLTLPEQLEQLRNQTLKPFLEHRGDFSTLRLSAEDKQRLKTLERMKPLVTNCEKWYILAQLLQDARQSQTIPESESRPENLVQKVEMLRQKIEQFDPTKPYSQQMTKAEWRLLDDIWLLFGSIERRPAIIEGLLQWLKERQ